MLFHSNQAAASPAQGEALNLVSCRSQQIRGIPQDSVLRSQGKGSSEVAWKVVDSMNAEVAVNSSVHVVGLINEGRNRHAQPSAHDVQ